MILQPVNPSSDPRSFVQNSHTKLAAQMHIAAWKFQVIEWAMRHRHDAEPPQSADLLAKLEENGLYIVEVERIVNQDPT